MHLAENSPLQVTSRSYSPEKRTPTPIQQLDAVLLSNIVSMAPEKSNSALTKERAAAAVQQLASPTLQSRAPTVSFQRRVSPPSNRGISVVTQTKMSTSQNQEPSRRQSPTGQKRNSPSPKRYVSMKPSKRQTSPTFQRRVSPPPVLVTAQTQTSLKPRRLNSDRHHSPILHRRVSTSPKRWGSRKTAQNHNAPTTQRRPSPTSRRAISPISRRRRSASPSYENNPVVSQRRGPAAQSYVNIPASIQSSRSKVAEDGLPATKLRQPSFRKDQNPIALTKSSSKHIPLAPPLPPRPNKNLYKKQSSSHRNKETGKAYNIFSLLSFAYISSSSD